MPGRRTLSEENWERIIDVNLKSVFLTSKHVLPVMREQESGVIINISSIAAVCSVGLLAYKTSKAGVNALTHSLALGNARYGIRVNAIMPGLMNTPMAIERISQVRGVEREQLIRAAGRAGAARREDGHGVGHRVRGAVPGVGRGEVHHGRDAAGGRRAEREDRLIAARSPSTQPMCDKVRLAGVAT